MGPQTVKVNRFGKKLALKITWILASSRRTQARHKDLVKITAKFIRRGIYFQTD
jgi:hypothetical protein